MAQNNSCGAIIVLKASDPANKYSVRVFSVNKGPQNSHFGLFYSNLKPYVCCTPRAAGAFRGAQLCGAGQLLSFITGLSMYGAILGLEPPYHPAYHTAFWISAGGFVTFYLYKRACIKKAIDVHNRTLSDFSNFQVR